MSNINAQHERLRPGILALGLAMALAASAATANAQHIRPVQTIVATDGKKLVVYDRKKLVFYDGYDDTSHAVAEVNLVKQRVISSPSGKCVVVRSAFYNNSPAPIKIYKNTGEKIGEFASPAMVVTVPTDDGTDEPSPPMTVTFHWDAFSISDAGSMLTLQPKVFGPPSPSRQLRNADGQLLTESSDSRTTHFAFDQNGMPYIYGNVQVGKRRVNYAALLDSNGIITREYRYDDKDAGAGGGTYSPSSKLMFLVVRRHDAEYADRIDIWNTVTGTLHKISVPHQRSNGVLGRQVALSHNGEYAVITRISQIDLRSW